MSLDDVRERIASIPLEKLEELAKLPGVRERIGATAILTERQIEANALLDGPSTHVMLFGGARSGKTFIIVRKIFERALFEVSRHAIMRHRFNHVIRSIGMDTLPAVIDKCFPAAAEGCRWDKQNWIFHLPNGSEIWLGGLDDKERTEKILGQEFCTIYLNECSEIRPDSRDIVLTRLAQNTKQRRKMFYDCNPPSKRHWTYLEFIEKISIARHQPLVRPENYVSLQINPEHNRKNLPQDYLDTLDGLPDRQRRRFLLGVFSDDDETALFPPEILDKGRLLDGKVPDMRTVLIGVDPSGCSGPQDTRSDEVGISVCGIGEDGTGYVLADLSGRYAPDQWKEIVAKTFDRYAADAVVAETNFGGAMVREVIRTAVRDGGMPIPVREVHASRGKAVRAEPISALFAQGKVRLVGRFNELENQLLDYTVSGFNGLRSPDRADAMIWALTALFPAVVSASRPNRSDRRVILGYSKSKGQRHERVIR